MLDSMPASQAQLITPELLDSLIEQARQSPRKRKNYNFHASDADNPHRFLNAILRGSYIRPHRHTTPPKPEAFLVLRGYALLFCFDDAGRVTERYLIGDNLLLPDLPAWLRDYPTSRGIDLPAGVWHSIAALTEEVVIYEVKPGPYSPVTDKDFAPWSPVEGDDRVAAFLDLLLSGNSPA